MLPIRAHQSSRGYRSDIDGLRAVAVLLVVANHLRTQITGGYIGVDVFFVISGYLISPAIVNDLNSGNFSIIAFYERRVRRILPALVVMLLATCVAAWFLLFPTELADFAGSLLSAVFGISNFWFWHQTGYFDAQSLAKPLLHTWSLGVEEQFYFIFPVCLVFLRRTRWKSLKLATWAATVLTFALAILSVHQGTSQAFFFAPLRAWEFLIGTIVGLRYVPPIRRAIARNGASALGLLLILIPAILYTDSTLFPGLAALPPCIGAALILAAGQFGTSAVGRLLSSRPVALIGLMSYSVYLWHWPLIAFQHIAGIVSTLPADSRILKAEPFAIALVLGYVSWRFVETPFRTGRLRPARRALFAYAGVGILAVACCAMGFRVTRGLPSRFPPDALAAERYLQYDRRSSFREGTCFLSNDDRFSKFNSKNCLTEDPTRKNILLFGDSHAAQLSSGMQTIFPDAHFLQATVSGCSMFRVAENDAAENCRSLSAYMHRDYLPSHRLSAILFGERWVDSDLPRIETELAWMRKQGINVILVGPMIEYAEPFPRVLAIALRDKSTDRITRYISPAPRKLDAQMAQLARDRWHVRYLSYFATLCTPDCPLYGESGVPLIFDEHHLTAAGSHLFARRIRDLHALPFLDPTAAAGK